ncbi:type II secretion system protein GspM [Pseudomonas sp. NPDC089569]|uniref:type II secretion system protein GspM n=1 Tax=Pseudomonas sp. NPDC089569 TaxID=3390722 RepID=UPI003D04A950
MKPVPWKTKVQRLSLRERRLVLTLGLLVSSVAAFSLIWQPTQLRLAAAERQYQQQLVLAVQLQQAHPGSQARVAVDQPLSLRVSESAMAAGLEMHQMDSDNDLLRLTLSGDAMALLSWLDRIERDGVMLQSLTLEKRDSALHAQAVLRSPL